MTELVALAEAIGAPVYVEFIPNTASFPGIASALSRHDDPHPGRRARGARPARPAVLGRRRSVHLVAALATIDPCRPGCRSSISTPIPGRSARTIRPRSRSSAIRRRRCRRSPAASAPRMTASAQARRRAHGCKSATDAIKKTAKPSAPRPAPLAGKTPVQPLALLEAIGDMLPKDAVVIEEVLSSAPGMRSLIHSDDRAELLRPARRRHRLGLAGRDRRQARAARPAGGGAHRRRQRHVHGARRCGPRRTTGSPSSG